jgi:hypothetical protein
MLTVSSSDISDGIGGVYEVAFSIASIILLQEIFIFYYFLIDFNMLCLCAEVTC